MQGFLCKVFGTKHIFADTFSRLRLLLCKQLKEGKGLEKLPPTEGSIHKHILRAHLVCSEWQQALDVSPIKLNPEHLGWKRLHDTWVPEYSDTPEVPTELKSIVHCNCDKGRCSIRCKCRENGFNCSESCRCGGGGDECMNKATDKELIENDDKVDVINESDDLEF